MTNFNDEISEYIDAKYSRIQRLRDAHKSEMQAVVRKWESAIRIEYDMALARAKKIP